MRNDRLKGVLLPDISKEFGGDCSAGVGRGRFTKGKEALYGIGGSSVARNGGGRGGGGRAYSLDRGTRTGGRTEKREIKITTLICTQGDEQSFKLSPYEKARKRHTTRRDSCQTSNYHFPHTWAFHSTVVIWVDAHFFLL